MRRITVKNLVLQFDADQETYGDDRQQVLQALEAINEFLQREHYGLAAQILTTAVDNSDIESGPICPDEDEDDFDDAKTWSATDSEDDFDERGQPDESGFYADGLDKRGFDRDGNRQEYW